MALKMSWRGPEDPAAIKAKYRKVLAKHIRDGIRERVSKRGLGAHGPLKGYSQKPLKMFKGTKPRKTPARGWGSYHEGGYKQYRDELGMPSDIFVFSNIGTAWKDWRASDNGSGPIAFGFANGLNNMAADAAQDNGRPDMFEPDDNMMDEAAQALLDSILDSVYGKGKSS